MRSVAVIGAEGPLARRLASELARHYDFGVLTAPAGGTELKALLHGERQAVDAVVVANLLDEATPKGLSDLKRVLEAVADSPADTVVLLGSALAYGAHADNAVPLPESAPLRPDPAFAEAFAYAEGERVLAEWADDHPAVRVVALRPAPVVGPGGEGRLAVALGGVRGVKAQGEQTFVQFLHVDDLASATALALDPASKLSGPANVAPDGWIADDTAAALFQGVGRVGVPAKVASVVRRAAWKLGVGRTPPMAEAWTSHPWVVASDRLRSAGWKPSYSNEEALVATHEGSPLMEMSPKRKQEVALGVTGGVIVAGGAVAAALVRRARRAAQ